MEAFWTQTSDIEARIDAEFYRLEFVEAERRLRGSATSRPLSELWKEYNRIYIGIAGFDEIPDNDLYTHYLRPADIGPNGEIDYDHLPYCKQYWLNEHGKKGCALPGDLVVEVKGNTRKVAVINERIPKNCIVSGSSYRIVLKDDMDPHFVQAYLLSATGQLLKRRLTSNTTIQYIDPESFRGMLIPIHSSAIQRAIGNKIRKSERCRELANIAWHRATERLQEVLSVYMDEAIFKEYDAVPLEKTGYSCLCNKPAVMLGRVNDKLGAQYYHPRRILAQDIAASAGNLAAAISAC